MVGAFATIANNGFLVSPYYISQIINNDKKILYQKKPDLTNRFFKKTTANKMKELLRYRVEKGDLKNINIAPNIYATIGYNKDFSNNWLIGFDNNKVIGIWLGYKQLNRSSKVFENKILGDLFANIARNIMP